MTRGRRRGATTRQGGEIKNEVGGGCRRTGGHWAVGGGGGWGGDVTKMLGGEAGVGGDGQVGRGVPEGGRSKTKED